MGSLITYRELEESNDICAFVAKAIERHRAGELYRTARSADSYYAQRNEGIRDFTAMVWTLEGTQAPDPTATVTRMCSNFFRRLVVQRVMYSLGKGVSFAGDSEGSSVKDMLGDRFDEDIKRVGKYAVAHGISFAFWNLDHIDVFRVTEFAPIWDEDSGALRAGIRWWQVSDKHPVNAVLYTEDGFTTLKSDSSDGSKFTVVEEQQAYITNYERVAADGIIVAVSTDNYSKLPIIPVWGSETHQSALVGLKEDIDSYDFVKNGFANDLKDCAEIYWMVENFGGMTDSDYKRMRDRLKLMHIVDVDTSNGGGVKPYTQEIPFEAREALLNRIKADIYEGFGALDVHTVAAGATNDHIDAAYQPMDEEADDFESNIRECIMDILALNGVEDTPVFTRNRISNVKEQVEVIALEAEWLDEETILRKLPNVTPDEVAKILERKDGEAQERMVPPVQEDAE